jgi:uncharacterized protein (DUF433 family)
MTSEERTTLTIDKLITCDAEIMSGIPVFKNTRVPIKNLIDYLETGESLDDFLEDFPSVSREQAVQTLKFAREVLLTQAYANSSG